MTAAGWAAESLGLRRLFQYAALQLTILVCAALMVLQILYAWLKKRGDFFYVLRHDKKPDLAGGWTHDQGFLQVNGVKLHYVEAGERHQPLMLLIHGFAGFNWSWKYQVHHYKKNYHVVAIDLRGTNESDKPLGSQNYTLPILVKDVAAVIRQLGGGKAILVGHDVGALIAWTLAEEQPELVSRLIVLNCPIPRAFLHLVCSNARQLMASWKIFAFMAPYIGECLFQADDYRFLGDFVRESMEKRKFTERELEYYKHVFSKPYGLTGPLNLFRGLLHLFPDHKFQESLRVKPKTLILWSKDSPSFPLDGAHHSVQYCEDARLRIIPSSCHFVMLDEPSKVNGEIDEWLAE